MITINIYRTTINFLIKGTQVQKFIQKVMPMIQSWAQHNQKAIEVIDKKNTASIKKNMYTECQKRGRILSSSSRKE